MKIFEVIDGMSNVRRWSHAYCHKEEFVIEHTGIVALIALKIGRDLDAHIGVLLEKALLHDMEEIITGDIPTPTKYANSGITDEIRKYERIAAKEVAEVFGSWAFTAWESAKDDTLEGQIIKLADAAAVVYKILRELKLGNTFFEQYKSNVWIALEKQRIEPLTHEKLRPIILKFQYMLIDGDKE